jgi:hypothetical protein
MTTPLLIHVVRGPDDWTALAARVREARPAELEVQIAVDDLELPVGVYAELRAGVSKTIRFRGVDADGGSLTASSLRRRRLRLRMLSSVDGDPAQQFERLDLTTR